MFKAVRVFEEEGKFIPKIIERSIEDLPAGDMVIKVSYSSLNYKDALSCIGNRGVTREYPHTPGIDASGVVVESTDSNIKAGDEVIVTGYDLGMNTDGGFGEYIRVPASWVVKKPEGISLKEAMIYGTAGFTSALSVYELVEVVKPEAGPILVIGAAGGVGRVGSEAEREFVLSLGARDTISREEADDKSGKPMLKQLWAGVIDTVGGNPLSTGIRATKYGGVVTTCGNVAGGGIPEMNVYPFILRGVRLIGIDSVKCPVDKRVDVWKRLSDSWKGENLDRGVIEVGIEEILEKVKKMLNSELVGRVLLKH